MFAVTIFMWAVLQVAMAGWMKETMSAMWEQTQGVWPQHGADSIHNKATFFDRHVVSNAA